MAPLRGGDQAPGRATTRKRGRDPFFEAKDHFTFPMVKQRGGRETTIPFAKEKKVGGEGEKIPTGSFTGEENVRPLTRRKVMGTGVGGIRKKGKKKTRQKKFHSDKNAGRIPLLKKHGGESHLAGKEKRDE